MAETSVGATDDCLCLPEKMEWEDILSFIYFYERMLRGLLMQCFLFKSKISKCCSLGLHDTNAINDSYVGACKCLKTEPIRIVQQQIAVILIFILM